MHSNAIAYSGVLSTVFMKNVLACWVSKNRAWYSVCKWYRPMFEQSRRLDRCRHPVSIAFPSWNLPYLCWVYRKPRSLGSANYCTLAQPNLGFPLFYTTQQAAAWGQPAMARGAQWLSMAINITNSNACLIQTFHKSQISSEYSKTSVSASAVIAVYIINYYEHNSFQLTNKGEISNSKHNGKHPILLIQ